MPAHATLDHLGVPLLGPALSLPVTGFELEHTAELRTRWEAFQTSVARGYDTLPDGTQVKV